MNAWKLVGHGLKLERSLLRRLPNYTSRALLTFDVKHQNEENNKDYRRFKSAASIFALIGIF